LILVFGGSGQLGQELRRLAHESDTPLQALTHHDVDIADAEQVLAAIFARRPEVVVNAAAYTNVDLAESETAMATRTNETGAAVLASACATGHIPLIHISTDYVFDGTKSGAYVESDPINPVNFYGRSKARGEAAVRNALAQHVILRTSWLYGPLGKNFLRTMLRLARERDEIRVVADQHGCPTSTCALARAILAMSAKLGPAATWGTFHFAARGATTWHGFATEIVKLQAALTGRQPPVVAISSAEYVTPAARPRNSELDCSLYDRVFGASRHSWDEDLKEIVPALLTAADRVRAPHVN
jgi:dTDP-4-dehydrorhamnose reductase